MVGQRSKFYLIQQQARGKEAAPVSSVPVPLPPNVRPEDVGPGEDPNIVSLRNSLVDVTLPIVNGISGTWNALKAVQTKDVFVAPDSVPGEELKTHGNILQQLTHEEVLPAIQYGIWDPALIIEQFAKKENDLHLAVERITLRLNDAAIKAFDIYNKSLYSPSGTQIKINNEPDLLKVRDQLWAECLTPYFMAVPQLPKETVTRGEIASDYSSYFPFGSIALNPSDIPQALYYPTGPEMREKGEKGDVRGYSSPSVLFVGLQDVREEFMVRIAQSADLADAHSFNRAPRRHFMRTLPLVPYEQLRQYQGLKSFVPLTDGHMYDQDVLPCLPFAQLSVLAHLNVLHESWTKGEKPGPDHYLVVIPDIAALSEAIEFERKNGEFWDKPVDPRSVNELLYPLLTRPHPKIHIVIGADPVLNTWYT